MIGLIVNPLAGMGARLAARGSDRFADIEAARAQGAIATAGDMAIRALRRLPACRILTGAGGMGLEAARDLGFQAEALMAAGPLSTAADTRRLAALMIDRGVSLILFAGGDGTARDIFAVTGDRVPLIGIPAGVKMHSAVFALTPEKAGEIASRARAGSFARRPAEIMDADEAALAAGRPSARLFGYAATPDMPHLLQAAKAVRTDGGNAAMMALGRRIAHAAPSGDLILLGPGTTMQALKQGFGIEGSLMGVDAVRGGALRAADATASALEALCAAARSISLYVGVIGNQGFVLGRGNRQISPAVIRAAGRDNIHIVATREKLAALSRLHADTGDLGLDTELAGFHRVLTGPNDSMVMRLGED